MSLGCIKYDLSQNSKSFQDYIYKCVCVCVCVCVCSWATGLHYRRV